MRKPSWSIALSVLVVLAAVICFPKGLVPASETGKKTPPPVQVKIDNFSFSAATLTVPAGTTVTWTNQDDVPHTVVSTDKVFASPVLDTNDKYSFTFVKPGTYPYFCSIHPKMTAKVVVE